MLDLTLSEVLAACRGRFMEPCRGPERLAGLSTDTRTLGPGFLYVPVVGQRFDGHQFVRAALDAGAVASLVSEAMAGRVRDEQDVDPGRLIVVDDTLEAFHRLAAAHRRKFDIPVVAVTGSIGKTSTKDLLAALLATRYPSVIKTAENLNNEFGVPRTVFRINPATGAAVIEMAMRASGEIRQLARIVGAQVGLITTIGESHLERLGTVQAIADAKGELVEELAPGGVAVLPRDSEWYGHLAHKARGRVISFGKHPQADVRVVAVRPLGFTGSEADLEVGGRLHRFTVPQMGEHNVVNFAGAVAALTALGHDAGDLVDFARHFEPTGRRLEVVGAPQGWQIVNDVYNASPASMGAALATLAALEVPGRRIAVLGDMFELGPQERVMHAEVGRKAAPLLDFLVTVGNLASEISRGAREAGMAPDRIVHVPDSQQAVEVVRGLLAPGDVVLVKASRGMQLDTVVKGLLAEGGHRG